MQKKKASGHSPENTNILEHPCFMLGYNFVLDYGMSWRHSLTTSKMKSSRLRKKVRPSWTQMKDLCVLKYNLLIVFIHQLLSVKGFNSKASCFTIAHAKLLVSFMFDTF